MANVAKYKAMKFQPGVIRSGISEDAVGQRSMGRGGDAHGEAKTADTMPIIGCGSHNGVYDGASEADAQYGDINMPELDASQSDIKPALHFQFEIPEGNLPVPMPPPRLPGVVLYLERPPESLQPETVGG